MSIHDGHMCMVTMNKYLFPLSGGVGLFWVVSVCTGQKCLFLMRRFFFQDGYFRVVTMLAHVQRVSHHGGRG